MSNTACSREQLREAAVWMTLLRGPDRTEKLERGFNRWLKANPRHAAAFEKIATAWEVTASLPRGPFPSLSRWQRAGFREGFVRAAAAVAVIAVIIAASIFAFRHDPGVATGVGEQRMLALDDGTRVFLNTDTRVVVKYDDRERLIELKSGEALFEVAKQRASWPFRVKVEGQEITALGTSFVVRRDDHRVSVTLVEGRVAVKGRSSMTTLSPGQRITLSLNEAPSLDQPALEKVTAWRAGQVDLDEVPLADAVAEMNRYSKTKLIVERAQTAAIPITGIFRAGDSVSFANAVVQTYGLQALEERASIVLAGLPGRPRMKARQDLSSN